MWAAILAVAGTTLLPASAMASPPGAGAPGAGARPRAGTLYAWGWNNAGQFGDGATTDSSVPVRVPTLTGVTAITSNSGNTRYVLRRDGTVWAWGRNAYGQLGNGATTDSPVPVRVSGLTRVTAIASSGVTARMRCVGTAPCGPGTTTRKATWGTGPPPTVQYRYGFPT
ncbi:MULTISPECIES: RCC1 domain-containing protein [Protofrankia]|nr:MULTISPECIES: RCC1 domain-containing protein [Protofrankia]